MIGLSSPPPPAVGGWWSKWIPVHSWFVRRKKVRECDVIASAAAMTVTVPVPTPTLPEIAALFLAMLLLGSGAYLLRRRQSGGLTPA